MAGSCVSFLEEKNWKITVELDGRAMGKLEYARGWVWRPDKKQHEVASFRVRRFGNDLDGVQRFISRQLLGPR